MSRHPSTHTSSPHKTAYLVKTCILSSVYPRSSFCMRVEKNSDDAPHTYAFDLKRQDRKLSRYNALEYSTCPWRVRKLCTINVTQAYLCCRYAEKCLCISPGICNFMLSNISSCNRIRHSVPRRKRVGGLPTGLSVESLKVAWSNSKLVVECK